MKYVLILILGIVMTGSNSKVSNSIEQISVRKITFDVVKNTYAYFLNIEETNSRLTYKFTSRDQMVVIWDKGGRRQFELILGSRGATIFRSGKKISFKLIELRKINSLLSNQEQKILRMNLINSGLGPLQIYKKDQARMEVLASSWSDSFSRLSSRFWEMIGYGGQDCTNREVCRNCTDWEMTRDCPCDQTLFCDEEELEVCTETNVESDCHMIFVCVGFCA